LEYEPEEVEEVIDVDGNDKEKKAFEVEDLDKVKGRTEYGYGLWTRFLYNGRIGKVLVNPGAMGLARLA
jgi:hypothetical protein